MANRAESISSCRCDDAFRPFVVPQYAGGQTENFSNERELRLFHGDGGGSKKKPAVGQLTTTDCGIVSSPSGLLARRGDWVERVDSASVSGGGASDRGAVAAAGTAAPAAAAAGVVPCCPGRTTPCGTTMASCGGQRPKVCPAGDFNAPAVTSSKSGICRPCPLCGHRGCIDDGPGCCREACRADATAVSIARAVPATPVVATEAAKATVAPDSSDGNTNRIVSRAAVEAWTAAETWASVMAAATEGVATGREWISAETETFGQGTHPATSEPTETHRRPLGENGCVLSLPTSHVAGGVWESVVHRRNSVVHSSPIPGEATRVAGRCRRAGRAPSRLPRDEATNVSRNLRLRRRWSEGLFEVGKTGAVETFVPASTISRSSAAVIVLERIKHGEQWCKRRAMRMGLISLRAHRLQAARWREAKATAFMHCKRRRERFGLRGMRARVEWREQRGEEPTAEVVAATVAVAATADDFTRMRRIRVVVVMLRR